MEKARSAIVSRLGYRFSDPALLEQALTHRSAGPRNNERLEFLGDAILGFVVAEALFDQGPNHTEGELTRRRASVVRKETLAELARELGLGPALEVGAGELKSGGRDRDSILADAVEALVGALYLDAGFEICRERLLNIFAERLVLALQLNEVKDPKTRLQEALQSQGEPLPGYEVVNVEGAPHRQEFTVDCIIDALGIRARGYGRSRRKAEQAAAAAALYAHFPAA